MRVSIVICTLNRADSLEQTLQSLRYQRHGDIEVVVVNGPSTDNTEDVLQRWSEHVRIDHCPLPNLSVSRNIGIRAAGGDVVAFIDDDALPEFDWLVQALPAFDDAAVAGVGGIVFDHTGMDLQYRYSAANRFAESTARHERPYDDQCIPGTFQFPYLQGTNALFRRDALLHVGGFDETYDYYLDETDLCCRLVDAGYLLRQLADAPVHHKFLPSGIRDHQRVVTNWFPIMKNQAYFSYRHALGAFSEYDILEHSWSFLQSRVADARFHEVAGRLPPNAANNAAITCATALRTGVALGLERQHLRLGPVEWNRPAFHRFPTVDSSARRKITFVTSSYEPRVTGGIARFMSDLAPALARRGHEVRVITSAIANAAVDLEDGVWVHRVDAPQPHDGGAIPQAGGHINAFATAAVREIHRIGGWSTHDVVYGPMWDLEVLGALRQTPLPVAVQVATPIAVAAKMAGHLTNQESAQAMRTLMGLEAEVLRLGDLFHANSRAVAGTISEHYAGAGDQARWQVVHLGLIDRGGERPSGRAGRSGFSVLFVGRFESRKGIDTFLEAVERVAPEVPGATFIVAGEDRPLNPGEPLYGELWLKRHAHAPWIDQVRLVGPVSDAVLHELYRDADLVVLPSRYESFGLVMVEAMMHGRALISCDTSGIRDVVRNGMDGLLVPPGDVEALADSMVALLGDDTRRAALGTAARERFVETFHIDRFTERFEQFLQRARLSDASDAGPANAAPLNWQSAPTGSRAARLESGEGLWLRVTQGASARLAVETDGGPAMIVIDDGHEHSIALCGAGVARIAVSTALGRVGVHSSNGSVVVHGVIEIASAG